MAALDRMKRSHGYDCQKCDLPYDQRRHLKCGLIPAERLVASSNVSWGVVGGCYDLPTLCPGYTVGLPRVARVARLWGWEKRGSLAQHLAARGLEPSPMDMELLDIFAAEWCRAEAWESDQRRADAERNRGR